MLSPKTSQLSLWSIVRSCAGARTKNTTVLGSLTHVVAGGTLQYLFNGSRWPGRNPSERISYGATACEATHAQVIKLFEGAQQRKSKRYACATTAVFCVRMVLSGYLRRLPLLKQVSPIDLLTQAVALLASMPLDWGPRLEVRPNRSGPIIMSDLPPRARVSATHRAK